jgi:hypothetical protein
MRFFRLIPALLVTATCARSPVPGGSSASPQDSLALHLRHDLGILSHDSLRGRATPSPGLESAARFVAAELAKVGVEPFRSRALIQWYPLADTEILPESVTVAFPPRPPIRLGQQLTLLNDHGAARELDGEMVLVTGRISDSGLAHVDLSRATLIIPRATMSDLSPITRVSGPIMASNPHAIIFVSSLSDSMMSALNARPPARRRWIGLDPLALRPPLNVSHGIFVVRPEVVAPVLAAHGIDLAQVLADTTSPLRVQRIAGQRVRVTAPRRHLAQTSAPIVVGVIPGSDATLRNEFVVVSAHLDHLGVGAPAANGDSIYNGADDNASGVAVLLAVAREIGRGNSAPRRSVLFVATSGEEVGMWGSDFFAGHPDTPLSEFVANINVDGVGRAAWPDSIAVLGGAWSTLGRAARDAALRSQSGLIPSFAPHAGFNQSDQYAFARRGVPSVHIYSGKLHAYYHTPADAFDVIDFAWLTRVARYTHEVVTLVANDPRKPVWIDPYHASGRVPW